MLSRKRFYLSALALALLLACGGGLDEALIIGEWQAVAWTDMGRPNGQDPAQVRFAFREDGTYSYTNQGVGEEGRYRLRGMDRRLFVTPASTGAEFAVGIAKLTPDTLVLDMNRSGVPEQLVLLRKAE